MYVATESVKDKVPSDGWEHVKWMWGAGQNFDAEAVFPA